MDKVFNFISRLTITLVWGVPVFVGVRVSVGVRELNE